MASGSIKVRVRPLRIAFMVDPKDKPGLLSAIEASTFLWGGVFNPIIPAFKRTPKNWEPHRVHKLIKPEEIISGYLEAFDPDIIVPVGVCKDRVFPTGHREIVQLQDIVGDIDDTHTSKYGVGFIEVLADFIDKELKFKRNDNLKLMFPKLSVSYNIFLASIFGKLSPRAEEISTNYYGRHTDVTFPKATIQNFIEQLNGSNFFPRRLSSWSLEHIPRREPQIFVCDANKSLDIIDYWNLRAAGYHVLPIPIQILKLEKVKEFSRNVIEENFLPYRHNPKMYQTTTIQRSRSISENVVKEFCESLDITQVPENRNSKFVIRTFYPRLWNEWARENTRETVEQPYSHEIDLTVSNNDKSLELRSSDPKIKLFSEYSGHPRFANDFAFRFYSTQEPMAEVFPQGGKSLSSALGTGGFRSWRFSKAGPAFLASNEQEMVYLDLPRAENVMSKWLKELGWEVSLSPSGRMATQLFKQLSGTWGLNWLAHKGLIALLGELEKEGGMPRQALTSALKKIISANKLFFDIDRYLELLIEANALRLGAKVQCPVCTRYNWFELNALEYEMRCRFCLSDFPAPVHSPKDSIKWTYRAHGPFASSVSQGAFSVLLVLKFLAGRGMHDHGVTPLFSYTAKKDGKKLEADLTCLYSASTWRVTKTQVVHVECKSFNGFLPVDFKRMKSLALEFPGSSLIFATFKDALSPKEISSLKKFVISQRKKRLRGLPNSPIIVLTGTELFSMSGAPECWNDKGGLYENFINRGRELSELISLADATQQLYLGLPSWFDWTNEMRAAKSKEEK